jgi:hypothetical protein
MQSAEGIKTQLEDFIIQVQYNQTKLPNYQFYQIHYMH